MVIILGSVQYLPMLKDLVGIPSDSLQIQINVTSLPYVETIINNV